MKSKWKWYWVGPAIIILTAVIAVGGIIGREIVALCTRPVSPPAWYDSPAFWDPHTESLLFLAPSQIEGWGEHPSFGKASLWRLINGQWKQLSDCAEAPPLSHLAAFDPGRQELVCLSGTATVVWDGASWTVIASENLSGSTCVYFNSGSERIEFLDLQERKLFVFSEGNWEVDTTFEMGPLPKGTYLEMRILNQETGVWETMPDADSLLQTMIFDPKRSGFVFSFSSAEKNDGRSLIYEFSGGDWRKAAELAPESLLGWTYGRAFVRDPLRNRILLIADDSSDGNWTKVYEVGDGALELIPSGEWGMGIWRRTYAYHPGYDGILMHGERPNLLFVSYAETWLARYDEAENRFVWERLN